MNKRVTILLVLREGGDFSMRDVQLIVRHINGKWRSLIRPRIICLWDKASGRYDLPGYEVWPLGNSQPGTWSRIELYSPRLEEIRPFLYIDLDTAVINSLEKIIELIPDEKKFITLEDLWKKGHLATGLAWIPAGSEKVKKIWDSYKGVTGSRMDRYIESVTTADLFWQSLTKTICDFKPQRNVFLETLPSDADIVCFHGKPRIFDAIQSWVKEYVEQTSFSTSQVTVIIPYNKDRGWLQEAIDSVPKNVQLLLGKGDGNWPENFNKVWDQVGGKYVRWLHEDDMLSENCIDDSVNAIEAQNVDFIHGNAIEIRMDRDSKVLWKPRIKYPTWQDIMQKNTIHQVTLMYRREVFEKIGILDDSLNTMEEFEFHLRCLKGGMKIGYCDAVLGIYRRHDEQKVKVYSQLYRREVRERVKAKYA